MRRIPHPPHQKQLSRRQAINKLKKGAEPQKESQVLGTSAGITGDVIFQKDFVYREPNILIATPVWKRPRIFEFWAERMKPLGCDILVVGSEGEQSRQLAQKHGFFYIEKPNIPFGAKLNARSAYFLNNLQYTHLLLVGSDDILCPRAFRLIQKNIYQYDIVSWMDCYYYEWETGRIAYMAGFKGGRKGEPMAPGRCLSRRVVEHIGPEMWSSGLKRYPDGNLWKKLRRYGNQLILSCKKEGCAILDVKSATNLNSMDSLFRHKLAQISDSIHVRRIIKNIRIGENVCVGKRGSIGAGTIIGNNVEIRDDVSMGTNCLIESGSIIGNKVRIEDGVTLSPYVIVEDSAQIGKGVTIRPFSVVSGSGKIKR